MKGICLSGPYRFQFFKIFFPIFHKFHIPEYFAPNVRNYKGFYHSLGGYYNEIRPLHCGINNFEKDSLAVIFKWLQYENETFQDHNYPMKIYLRHLLYHILSPKSQRFLQRKSYWGSWSSWGFLVIGFSLRPSFFFFLYITIFYQKTCLHYIFKKSDSETHEETIVQ